MPMMPTNATTLKRCYNVLFILGLCKSIVFPQWGRRGIQVLIPQARTTSRKTPSTGQESKRRSQKIAVCIRKSQRGDLAKVAAFLSTAASSSSLHQGNGFRARIDRMFAQADIEKLLESRWRAVYEANRSWERICRQVNIEKELPLDVHRYWWTNSDRLRSSIAAAVALTAEPTMFDSSSIHIMPQPHALQHLQLTATHDNNVPIGFCEVAMEPPHGQPLVLNVAVDPMHRRRGVGRRLLRTAERYVRRNWKAGDTSPPSKVRGMGLYVDPSNHAAVELYRSLGFSSGEAWLDDETFEGPRDVHHQPMTYMYKAFFSKSTCDQPL